MNRSRFLTWRYVSEGDFSARVPRRDGLIDVYLEKRAVICLSPLQVKVLEALYTRMKIMTTDDLAWILWGVHHEKDKRMAPLSNTRRATASRLTRRLKKTRLIDTDGKPAKVLRLTDTGEKLMIQIQQAAWWPNYHRKWVFTEDQER